MSELGEVIKKLGFTLRLSLGTLEFLLFWNMDYYVGLMVENWPPVIAVLLEFRVELSDALIL